MKENRELIFESLIRDLSEGVMTVGLDGVIGYVNPAASLILGYSSAELEGRRFAEVFFGREENDAFNQTMLEAIYDKAELHENIVCYYCGEKVKQLHVTTSFLNNGEERIGVIAAFRDISELSELRDAVKAMRRIQALNDRLEMRNRLLSETFGRFLSDDIVSQLLETPDGLALGGRKRRLSVLMSDVRGFTALSERMNAQSLIEMLNHYLGEMTEIIQKNDGTIIEFIGDGIMAIFGAPNPSEAHAQNAVRAAAEMQCRMAEVNEWNLKRGYPRLEMGVGINTGDMIVGNIGSEKRTKYGVVGMNVNLAGRIESYTVGGEILISPETRAEVTEPVEIREIRTVLPKGLTEPIDLVSVAGIGDVSLGFEEDEPVRLERPVDGSFYVISEKQIGADSYPFRFTAISATGAVIVTEKELELYGNLEMEAGGVSDIFAKVLVKRDGNYLLRFTSLPEGFSTLFHNKTE